MKSSFKTSAIAIGLTLSLGTAQNVYASEEGDRIINRSGELAKVGTLQLCIDYHSLENQSERDLYIKELDLRSQLSVKDHKYIPQHKVQPSMTMCGMYMSIGKPLGEKSRQIRPMTFKTVHVYPDMYYVSQSGMVVEAYPREEGSMPPKLVHEVPKVQPSPTLK